MRLQFRTKVMSEEIEIVDSFIAATRSGKMRWKYDRETETFSPRHVTRYVQITVGKDILLLERNDSFVEISGGKVRILWALLRGILTENNKNGKEYTLKETRNFIERVVKRK